MQMNKPGNVQEYIGGFPHSTRQLLEQVRETILKAAPGAEEGISYGMPAYKLSGKPLVYFGGFANHIGFYATPTGHRQFEKQLAGYRQGKGSVQFPLDEPMPLALVARIVKFRMKENLEMSKQKKKK
jgi:uncharacterized protein YdhG (YjbR/CyaY superfamily)